MKKKFLKALAVMALALTTSSSFAQVSKHEFRAGFGIGDDTHLENVQDRYISKYNLEEGNFTDDWNMGYQASAYLEYFYHINKHWAVGSTLGYAEADGEGARERWLEYNDTPGNEVRLHSKSLFLMPQVKYSWIAKNHFRLYSKAAVGAQLYNLKVTCERNFLPNRNEEGIRLAYQVSPLGIEAGGERMRGFVELGYGKQGVLNVGLLLNL